MILTAISFWTGHAPCYQLRCRRDPVVLSEGDGDGGVQGGGELVHDAGELLLLVHSGQQEVDLRGGEEDPGVILADHAVALDAHPLPDVGVHHGQRGHLLHALLVSQLLEVKTNSSPHILKFI